jgi:hypothetical protein
MKDLIVHIFASIPISENLLKRNQMNLSYTIRNQILFSEFHHYKLNILIWFVLMNISY